MKLLSFFDGLKVPRGSFNQALFNKNMFFNRLMDTCDAWTSKAAMKARQEVAPKICPVLFCGI